MKVKQYQVRVKRKSFNDVDFYYDAISSEHAFYCFYANHPKALGAFEIDICEHPPHPSYDFKDSLQTNERSSPAETKK